MTTATTAIRRPPRWLVQMLSKPGNLLPAGVWLFMLLFQIFNSSFPFTPSTTGVILINTVTIVLFMVRRDPTKVGSKSDLMIALLGTFTVSLLQDKHSWGNTDLFPTIVQVVGIAGWAWSLSTLGRSFGIVAADRGLVKHGPYRLVRHPVYAFEILFFLGYFAAVPTLWSGAIISIWIVFQCMRIVREERIIDRYDEYRRTVRWRLIPFVW